MSPFFSVIIPLYNKADVVLEAVNSVLSQSFADFELIIVDDGSSDGGGEKITHLLGANCHYIRDENRGVSAARNRGATLAKGRFLCFLDADDWWEKDTLKEYKFLLEEFGTCPVAAVAYQMVYPNAQKRVPLVRGLGFSRTRGIIKDYFSAASLSDPILCSSAICIDKQFFWSIGGFPAGIAAGEDYVTWFKLALKGTIAYSQSAFVYYRNDFPSSKKAIRLPQSPDQVSKIFWDCISSGNAETQQSQVLLYVARWHRIRATEFLSHNRVDAARWEIYRAICLDKPRVRDILTIIIIMLFQKHADVVFRVLRRVNLCRKLI